MNTSKHGIRRRLNARVAEMSPRMRLEESRTLCDRLVSDPDLEAARVIGVYLALPDEPDLRYALETFHSRRQQLALPFREEHGNWVFRSIASLDGPATGPWGLAMPEPGPKLDAALIDAVLVPGRGFTRNGHRIGRSKGIYDRLLADGSARTIGIAFTGQLTEQLPHEPHDIVLDEVWIAD